MFDLLTAEAAANALEDRIAEVAEAQGGVDTLETLRPARLEELKTLRVALAGSRRTVESAEWNAKASVGDAQLLRAKSSELVNARSAHATLQEALKDSEGLWRSFCIDEAKAQVELAKRKVKQADAVVEIKRTEVAQAFGEFFQRVGGFVVVTGVGGLVRDALEESVRASRELARQKDALLGLAGVYCELA